MSEFDDFCNLGMEEAEGVLGSQAFTIDGNPYAGVLNEFEGEQAVELDGAWSTYNATLVCQKTAFAKWAKPLQRTLQGQILVIEGLNYSAKRVAVDGCSVTFGLVYAR